MSEVEAASLSNVLDWIAEQLYPVGVLENLTIITDRDSNRYVVTFELPIPDHE